MTDLQLLQLQLQTGFVLDGEGRIVRQNDPDRSPAPRVFFAGCREGNICAFRHDVRDEQMQEIRRVFAAEPLLERRTSRPLHLATYGRILADTGAVNATFALNFLLPNAIDYPRDGEILRSDTPEGRAYYAGVKRDGYSPGLRDVGFATAGELWRPWCGLVANGEIAALAFAARLGPDAADLGLVTVTAYRGRGFGAAVTAAWSAHPELAHRTLFYSTDQANVSSQRVTDRLGLRFIGASCRLV